MTEITEEQLDIALEAYGKTLKRCFILANFVLKIRDLTTLSTRVCYELKDEANKILNEMGSYND